MEGYAKYAVDLGQPVLSSVEHGWCGNVWDTVQTAREYDLRPLIGAEAYWVKDRTEKDNTNCHIILLAKNENGRQALNDVLSEANITGFYRQPRLDTELILSLPSDDIWCTSACIAGWKYEDAQDIWLNIAKHFGKNFFLEVQAHNTEPQMMLNEKILKIHKQYDIPIIAGCDSHYILPQDAQIRTDFLFSKGMKYPEEEGWYMDFPDGDTLYQRFVKQSVLDGKDIDEAMSNTNIFSQVEEYQSDIFNDDIKMPSLYPDWTQEQKDTEYQNIVWNGWNNYKHEVPEEQWDHYEEEIQKEIDTVIETHTADYFITNHYIIKQGKANGGRLTKTGRGSAVSFITNMLLGFTGVDRIKASVKMYPERFMSATRILQSHSLPDIDHNVDNQELFARAQQQVLGEDHAYPMVAFGTMKASSAWKLYAKSQGVPFEVANAVSEQIKKYEDAVKHADEDDKDSIDIMTYLDKQFEDIFKKSAEYRGLIVSWSIAPCSFLLYQGSIRKQFGLVKVKDHLCAAIDGHWAEQNHFLKNDILKVSCVEQIYDSYAAAGEELPDVNHLLDMCKPNDPAWRLYEIGCTNCLNQCEKTGTSARAAIYKPHNISELAAFVAAIRPGFKSMYKTFESRQPFRYGVQAFDSLIQTEEMPNSFVLYQEQEMAALNYAGIDMSDCYTAIKNIAKKRTEKVLAYKDKFISGFDKAMIENEHKTKDEAQDLSKRLWQIIEDSARYSFNASHSYCVALDSLYEAWIKAHHPLAFYQTALRIYEAKGDKDKMNELRDEAQNYFNIQFPPFRYGQDNRTINADFENNAITNSLTSIKGFGSSIGDLLHQCADENKEEHSFMKILKWLDEHSIKGSKVAPLIQIDYFIGFGNCVTLQRELDFFDFFNQGTSKSIKKDKLTDERLLSMLSHHATDKGVKGQELKSYTITDMDGLLSEYETYILSLNLSDLPYKIKAQNQLDILGYVDLTTHKEADRRKLFILDEFAIQNKWSAKGGVFKYRIKTKSIGSGKTAQLSINPDLMEKKPIQKGDIIYASKIFKDKKGYWNILDYEKII